MTLAPRARACVSAAVGLGPEDTARFIELHDGFVAAGRPTMDAARNAADVLVAEIRAEAGDLTALVAPLLPPDSPLEVEGPSSDTKAEVNPDEQANHSGAG